MPGWVAFLLRWILPVSAEIGQGVGGCKRLKTGEVSGGFNFCKQFVLTGYLQVPDYQGGFQGGDGHIAGTAQITTGPASEIHLPYEIVMQAVDFFEGFKAPRDDVFSSAGHGRCFYTKLTIREGFCTL